MSFRDELGLEVEIAVIRGQEWVYRGTFRPPAMISVGASPSAVLPLPGSNLPDHHELIRIYSDGGARYFGPGMAVELRLAEGIKRNDELLEEGLASPGKSGWKVPLGKGSKGAFRVAEVSVLFKVRSSSTAPVKVVKGGRPALCGTCGAELSYAIVGFGALTLCTSCKTLNEVQSEGNDAEQGPAQLAPVVKQPAELPTFDAISVAQVANVTPAQRLARGRLSDLPTFDAISVLTAKAPEPLPHEKAPESLPREEQGVELLASPREQEMPAAAKSPAANPPAAKPPATPLRPNLIPRGAELPTFDAISVLSKEELSDSSIAPTPTLVQPIGGTSTAEEIASWEPSSEVEVVIEEEDDFFFGENPVSIDLQRSYNALPVITKGGREAKALGPGLTGGADDPIPNPDFAAQGTRQVLVPEQMVEQAETIYEMEAGSPSAFVGGRPAKGREPAPPPTIVPTEARTPLRDGEEGSDQDDFLMGRVSLHDAHPVDDERNRWLIIIGVGSGLLGLVLIAYKVWFS